MPRRTVQRAPHPRIVADRALRRTAWLVVALVCLLCTGCAAVHVRSTSPEQYIAHSRGDILTTGALSEATQQTLAVSGLEDICRSPTQPCATGLMNASMIDNDQRLSALAELSLKEALAATAARDLPWSDAQFDLWLRAARFAYVWLFFSTRPAAERAFEDRQTQVRDFYNYAVQRTASALFQRMLINATASDSEPELIKHIADWQLQFDLDGLHLPAGVETPRALIPATSLRFSGLRSIYRRDGLGAQFVADADIRPTPPKAPRPANASALSTPVYTPLPASDAVASLADAPGSSATPHRRSRQERLAGGSWFSEMPYPVLTVLLKFPGATLDEVFARRDATLVVYDPYRTDSVDVNAQVVPLGANFSAGYGMWLARSDFGAESMASLLLPKYGISEPHIFLMQPFDPNRRIIVTLHGLASSPEAWVNVANEIQGDPTLRRKFQLWQVYYPTNVPIIVNLADIRQVLLSTLRHFDPNGQTSASRDIVLIGHSMGGVLSKALVSSSGDALWHVFADQYTPEGAQVERAHAQLDPYLRFTPLPGVERVVFIAAPHRGTSFARNPLGRWAANLIELPLTLLDDVEDATDAMMGTYGAQSANHSRRVPNSVDQLSDDDPMIRALATLPIAPNVRYNSIIARRQAGGPLENTDDGVVPYRSAHLEGADSEFVIRGWHSITDSPQAILELRRILHQDLNETGERN
ncbi:esterase/lipase family protein [Paraburkholderia unamae]|uniref:AB hydrolase-1 domain-containing protein n=1 Tax=Paraburkholderia unamae TaxID=219649 RepID=A0ABX5KU09_9BURK|nr:alpha/beta hydrolase [Paraburkholderia unamae]PVX86605.1 hypothetical protein C7402_102441 [Paraburkholderia unamae]CAG9273751.1 AB hydrolase-1 domain-containing protein [Paraburkholderia unamae]